MSISKLRKTVQKRIKVAGWILTAAIFISIPAYFSWEGVVFLVLLRNGRRYSEDKWGEDKPGKL